MDLESVRKLLEKGTPNNSLGSAADAMPRNLITLATMCGVHIDLIEPGRVLCSMKIAPRFGPVLSYGIVALLVDIVGSAPIFTVQGQNTSGVSVEISVSNVDVARVGDEIEIEAISLRTGKMVAVVSVELREKGTRRLIAQGRHSKFLGVPKL